MNHSSLLITDTNCIMLFAYSLFLNNSFPKDKFLDRSKSKAFADDKINVTKKLKFAVGQEENIVAKGENAGYQHFLLFPTMFSKALFFRVVKSWYCVVKSQAGYQHFLLFPQCFQRSSFPRSLKIGIVW